MQKAVAYIAEARTEKLDVDAVLDDALRRVEKSAKTPELTKAGLLRNLKIADELGVLDAAGLADMKRGQSPTVQRGPNKGDELAVDHIVPLAVAPEVGNVIANLEWMPARARLDCLFCRAVQPSADGIEWWVSVTETGVEPIGRSLR